jgi:hypothetical protein
LIFWPHLVWDRTGGIVIRLSPTIWGGLALLFATAPAIAGEASDSRAGALATRGQFEREKVMLRMLASPPMRDAIGRLQALYRADPQGSTATGEATIRRGVDAIAMAAVSYVVSDPARPVAMWTANAPHRWAGMDVPRSGYGIDNPDNAYRNFAVEGGSRYLIRGKVNHPGPIEQHFTLMDSIPGTTPLTVEGGGFLATLRSDELQIAPDGTFTISVDSDPADGRQNHLRMPPQGTFLLIVRDLFTDWRQLPITLDVERVAGEPSSPPDENELAHRAAALLDKIGPYWLDYDNRFVYSRPVNQVNAPRQRPGGRGFSTSGHFDLARGEALVVTLDPLGAASLGFQLTDPWGVAYEYRDRTSSLNNAQAKPNPDGTFTYVIAATDPGAYNWLDPDGFSAGMFAIRWQGLPPGADAAQAIRDIRRVPLDGLRQALAPTTVFITKAERKRQRAERLSQYDRRLCGDLRPADCARWTPVAAP